jgi:hypothetical protein
MADIRNRDVNARGGYDPRFDGRVKLSAKKAQDAANSTEKGGGDTKNNPNNTNTGPEVYRYPREALSNTTDALYISIFDQFRTSDTGASNLFNLDGLIEKTTTGTGDKKVTTIDSVNLKKLGVKAASDFFQNNPDKVKKKNTKYIYLPIPQQISDALAVSYSEDSLNPLQAVGTQVTAEILNDPGNVGTLISKLTKGNFEGLDQNTVKTIQSGLAGKALNSLGANVSPNSIISRATGQILQSNLELLFSGVTLRSFPFTFDFTPRDQVEAKEVMAIIRCLKSSMVPKKGSNPALFIGSPKVFQLEYVTGQREHPFLNRFKICSLAQLSVNYTASGTYATYPDGTPVHIQVLCEFKEINPIYAEDYEDQEDGYLAGGVGY